MSRGFFLIPLTSLQNSFRTSSGYPAPQMNMSGTIQGICHGGIQKLASGIEKLGAVFGNWKVVFGNWRVVFGNWHSETGTLVFGN